jgi:hypothetical protein
MHRCSALQVHFVKNQFYDTEVLSILKCPNCLFAFPSICMCTSLLFLNFIMSDCDIWHHCWIWWISIQQWFQFLFTSNKFWLNDCVDWLLFYNTWCKSSSREFGSLKPVLLSSHFLLVIILCIFVPFCDIFHSFSLWFASPCCGQMLIFFTLAFLSSQWEYNCSITITHMLAW